MRFGRFGSGKGAQEQASQNGNGSTHNAAGGYNGHHGPATGSRPSGGSASKSGKAPHSGEQAQAQAESSESATQVPEAHEYMLGGAKPGTSAAWLPINPHTGEPLQPMAQPGYYQGYSTLSQQNFWDEATRKVVLERVEQPPKLRFFKGEEIALMEAICARIIPQDDRDEQHRIPIVPTIDKRLATGEINGYRYQDMPPDSEVFHLGLKGVEAIAQHVYGQRFIALSPREQEYVLSTIHDDRVPAGNEYWNKMSVTHFWQLLVQDCIESYYAHPYAWDEIGFGGPAYPRGYMRLHGEPEYWEKGEHRYEWAPPPGAPSAEYKPIGLEDPLESQISGSRTAPAQEGTH